MIRDFHGLNRESVVPRDGRGESGQAIVAAGCLAIREWICSAGKSVDCEPREGATCRTQAISINIADRTQIISMALNYTFTGSQPPRQPKLSSLKYTMSRDRSRTIFGAYKYKEPRCTT